MKKITTLAAVLLIGGGLGGPAAFAQVTGEQNSGAGVPGLPGNKSGPRHYHDKRLAVVWVRKFVSNLLEGGLRRDPTAAGRNFDLIILLSSQL
jgi:hypothetical protein